MDAETKLNFRIKELSNLVRMLMSTQGAKTTSVLHADFNWSGGDAQALEARINAALPKGWRCKAESFCEKHQAPPQLSGWFRVSVMRGAAPLSREERVLARQLKQQSFIESLQPKAPEAAETAAQKSEKDRKRPFNAYAELMGAFSPAVIAGVLGVSAAALAFPLDTFASDAADGTMTMESLFSPGAREIDEDAGELLEGDSEGEAAEDGREGRRRASGNFMGLAPSDFDEIDEEGSKGGDASGDSGNKRRGEQAAPRPREDSSSQTQSVQTDQAGQANRRGEILRETPEDKVSKERLFRRPAIVFKKDPEKEAAGEGKTPPPEKFLFPSMSFLAQYDPWKLRIGDVVLLQDNYAVLKRRHPDCRRVESMDSEDFGRIACRNTAHFQAEGDEVIFTYAKVNEVLTGAAYAFNSRHRAELFARRIESTMKTDKLPTFDINPTGYSAEEARTTSEKISRSVDSPMFLMSVHPTPTGWLVNVESYFQDRLAESEVYAKAKVEKLEFGTLTIGETKKSELPGAVDLPKTCREVSAGSGAGTNTQEYYGLCFDFPYEAHTQLDFNPATGILETAVLSPIGISSGGIVEDMLRSRYGLPQYCRKTQSDVVLTEIKSAPQRGRAKMKRMKDRPSSVYAGSCEEPIIYSTDMRYVFENHRLNRDDVMEAFKTRKSFVDTAAERLQAFDAKKEKIKGFFE